MIEFIIFNKMDLRKMKKKIYELFDFKYYNVEVSWVGIDVVLNYLFFLIGF